MSQKHKHNITIIGALSYGKLFTRLAPTTNKVVVHKFFQEMAEDHSLRGTVMVLDNHRAHWSHDVRDLL